MEIDLGYAPVAVLLESRDYAIATISEEDYEQRATGVGLRPGPLWVRFGPRPVKTLFLEKRAHPVDLPERQVYSCSKWAKIPKNLEWLVARPSFHTVWVIKSRAAHIAGAA